MICLLVRDFATTQERCLNPQLSDAPLILIQAGKYRPKVIAPDALVRQAGVKAGMWVGEAKSLCPQATLLPVDESRYQRIFTDITCLLLAITDRIEGEYQATSTAWYSDDRLMMSYLVEAIKSATGIMPQIGIATSKFPSRVAAAITKSGVSCEIAEREEATFLKSYPVSLLPLDKLMTRRLPLLGINTLGQLGSLPRLAVWEQFGKHGRWLHDLANGIDVRPLTPFKAPVILSEKQSFDDPLVDRKHLHQSLEQSSLILMRQLREREAHQVGLIVTLANGTVCEHQRQVNQPIKDTLYLLRLLTQMLDSLLIDASVARVEVRLSDIRDRLPVQLSLFETRKPVMSLQQVAPEWASRYRQADFYHLHVRHEAILREERIERQRVSGA